MLDSYGRSINYLRISVTDLCNLRCRYCMTEKGIVKKEYENILNLEEIEKITKEFVKLGVNKIRITGGEPLVRKGLLKLIREIGSLKEVQDFAMTTNGTLLKKYARQLKDAGLDRVNVSLDTLDPKKYSYITRGGNIKDVLEGIEEARKVGLTPIKINIVLVKGFNEDEVEDFVKLTKDKEIDVRFIELMPIGQVCQWTLDKYLSNSFVLDKCNYLEKVDSTDKSSPAVYYKIKGGKGRVGFINPISCKFCSNCNRIRLTVDGKIKPCLHSNNEIDIMNPLRENKDISHILKDIIKEKPKEHNLEEGNYIKRNMMAIGG